MVNRPSASFTGAALTLVAVLTLLIGGGLGVRVLITRSFDTTTRIRNTLGESRKVLVAQLDEETGVRGFAATHDAQFLEPYERARVALPGQLDALRALLGEDGLTEAIASADDARVANALWIARVAIPLTSTPAPANPIGLELTGKMLVDRFRADIDRIIGLVGDRQLEDQGAVRSAIDRINFFIGLAAVIIAAFGAFFLDLQRRAALRIERERVRAEREEREAQALRAAFAAEKRIADSLQEAIAQRPLPTIPTLRFSATYVPATEETKVGGDWYDALELPHRRVLFAIGDVTGHGIEAAVTMNRARQSLISSALLEGDPASVLRRVNDEMFEQNAPLVTAVAGFADAGTYEFVYATAGHPPPLLMEPGRTPRLLPCGSLPLGAMRATEYTLHRVQSVPGATLVLYTDGAVEHSKNVLEGESLLIDAAAAAATSNTPDTASFIHDTIFAGRPVGDDVAILTIGFTTDAASSVTISADDAQSSFTGRLARFGPLPARPAGRSARSLLERWAS